MKQERSYKTISDLELKKMVEYYKTHTLEETIVFFRITDKTGLAQFLSRNAKKTTLGGARKKSEISDFQLLKNEIIEKLGKQGKFLIEKLLKLYDNENNSK